MPNSRPTRSAPAGKRGFGTGAVVALVLGLLFLVLLPFLPLLLAFAEYSLFGSNHVEDFCRTIGIHDFLSTIYDPILNLFSR